MCFEDKLAGNSVCPEVKDYTQRGGRRDCTMEGERHPEGEGKDPSLHTSQLPGWLLPKRSSPDLLRLGTHQISHRTDTAAAR